MPNGGIKRVKRVYPKEEVCIGCRLCEVHCLVEHSRSRDVVKAYKRESPRPLPRIRVEERGVVSLAVQCRHCVEPWCVYACLTGAMSRDGESGVVSLEQGRCVGCWTCVLACPYGAIIPDLARRMVAKCDLCPHLLVPACVALCPNGALLWVEE